MRPIRDNLTGTVIAGGKYRLNEMIGEGGGGQVYVGEQTAIGKVVAIKVLGSEYAEDPKVVQRFLREARAATRVEHENIVQIFDFGATEGGTAYIAMEYLEGESLAELIDREAPLSWKRTKTIALQICRALHVAHSNGVIHRDMKPANCFRVKHRRNEDYVKVLDFGLAKVFGDQDLGRASLSLSGKLFGTPEYLSPEQILGEPADDRSEVYSVGIMMFEMLTGRVPFESPENDVEVLIKHTEEPVPPPSEVAPQAKISPTVDALVLKVLEKDPQRRPQGMRELAEAILAIDDGARAPATGPVAVVATTPKPWLERDNAKLVVGLVVSNVVTVLVLLFALFGR